MIQRKTPQVPTYLKTSIKDWLNRITEDVPSTKGNGASCCVYVDLLEAAHVDRDAVVESTESGG